MTTLTQIKKEIGKISGRDITKECFIPGRGNCRRNCALFIEEAEICSITALGKRAIGVKVEIKNSVH